MGLRLRRRRGRMVVVCWLERWGGGCGDGKGNQMGATPTLARKGSERWAASLGVIIGRFGKKSCVRNLAMGTKIRVGESWTGRRGANLGRRTFPIVAFF